MTEQERVLAGGGEMGARMRALDWSQTPLGPVADWPPALRTSLSVVLGSPQPLCLYWGPEFVALYNDGYRRLLEDQHPAALGARAASLFARDWHQTGPLLEGVLRTQTPASLETSSFTCSFTPLRDEHAHGVGVLCFASETTPEPALAGQLRGSEERQRQVLEALGAGRWTVEGDTRRLTADARAVTLLGLPPGTVFEQEAVQACVHPEDRDAFAHALTRALAGHNGGNYFMVFRTLGREGADEHWVESRAQRLLSADGQHASLAGAMMDVTDRKLVELFRLRQARLYALSARVSQALARGTTSRSMLQACAEALMMQLKAALVRIWLLHPTQDVLELEASDGLYTHLDGAHGRVPVGQYKVGHIARERRPYLTNSLRTDARVDDPEWVRREKLTAFAGYPLLAGDKLVGMLALFSHQVLPEDTLDVLRHVADSIALGVERLRAEEALRARVDLEQTGRTQSS